MVTSVPTLKEDHIQRVLHYLSELNQNSQYEIRVDAKLRIFKPFMFGDLVGENNLGVDNSMECFPGSFDIHPSIEYLSKLINHWFKNQEKIEKIEPNLQITNCEFCIKEIIDIKESKKRYRGNPHKILYETQSKYLGTLKIESCLTEYKLKVYGSKTDDVIINLTNILTESQIPSEIKYENEKPVSVSCKPLNKKQKLNKNTINS